MSKKTELYAEQTAGLSMSEANRLIEECLHEISSLSGQVSPEEIAKIMEPAFAAITDIMAGQIGQTYSEAYLQECYEVQDKLGQYWKPRKMNSSQVNAFLTNTIAGENWRDRLQGHFRDYVQAISAILSLGDINNIPQEEIEAMLLAQTGTVGESGLTYKIMRIMRTESNNAVNRAAMAAYRAAHIRRYRVISILDDRLCTFCHKQRHRRVYAVSKAKTGDTLPPFHPNCRCYVVPVIDDAARKFAEQKGTAGKMGYQEWINNNYNQGTANEALKGLRSPLERSYRKGNPAGIELFGDSLNNKQKYILSKLQKFGDSYSFPKKYVSMRDLAALTATTGAEFAMLTKGNERLIIRGGPYETPMTDDEATEYRKQGYRLSGHTHPGITRDTLSGSKGDRRMLGLFEQGQSLVYNSGGKGYVFGRTEKDDLGEIEGQT